MSLRSRTPVSVATLALLLGASACSSSADHLDFDHDGGPGYDDDQYDEDPYDPANDEPNGGSGGEGDGAEDDGGELPPTPDDDGIDRGTQEEDASCDAAADVSLFLSPDDSNSMSSPVQAREAVLDGWSGVQAVAIRTWEFFNYYDFGYAPAEPGSLAIDTSLMPLTEGDAGEYLLQIGVSSEELSTETRAPMNLTFVLDTSGSMAGPAMEMLKESCRAIAASLREGDTVSMVTWSTDDALVLGGYSVSGPDDPVLLGAIEALETGGGTDLHGGLVAGYELAQTVYDAGATNRLVLVSDGGANAGITDIDVIAAHAGGQGQDGIYLVGVGVGSATTYHDDLMDLVTDAGKGASVFIGDEDEAWKVFHDDFISTMAVSARDVQVRLDMPPGFEIVSTSAEQVSSDATEVEPQHLAPNDTMVFHQRIRTCAPELLTAETTMTVTVHYLDALTFEAREHSVQLPITTLLEADLAPLLKGQAVFAYSESLKAYKRADEQGRVATMAEALSALEKAEAALPGDPELAEIRDVLEALAAGG